MNEWLRSNQKSAIYGAGLGLLTAVALAIYVVADAASRNIAPDFLIIALLCPAAGILVFLLWLLLNDGSSTSVQLERIANAVQKADEQQGKAKPFWDVAQTKLEAYIEINSRQVRSIFVVSLCVMIFGFVLIAGGILTSFLSPQPAPDAPADPNTSTRLTITAVSVASGIVIEFIGATFLFLYRSTILQAIRYVDKLERMNNVGMAMQILDIVSKSAEGSREDQVKVIDAQIEIAKQLLSIAGDPPVELPAPPTPN